MENYIRFFVSQHLGKARAEVSASRADEGQVRIDIDAPGASAIIFSFSKSRLAQRIPQRGLGGEAVVRIAINQLHKLLSGTEQAALYGTCHDLVLGGAPWMGDLSDVLYGGATDGYDRRGKP